MRPKYSLILSILYLSLAVLYVVVLVIGAGHDRNPFAFIFILSAPVCRLMDIMPDIFKNKTALAEVLSCLGGGLIQFALIGFVIDLIRSNFTEN